MQILHNSVKHLEMQVSKGSEEGGGGEGEGGIVVGSFLTNCCVQRVEEDRGMLAVPCALPGSRLLVSRDGQLGLMWPRAADKTTRLVLP